MKDTAEIKELFINNAIHLIAKGGFEKATTKELTHYSGNLPGFKMNEAYIYRIFGSKEKLYEAAFLSLDRELYDAFHSAIALVGQRGADIKNIKTRMYEFFLLAWRFILGDEDRCRCYLRYYYSVYFKGHSLEIHNKLFGEMISILKPLFKDEADVFSIMHSVFISLFDFAIRVYNGDLVNDDTNRPHVFNVLYCMMSTYFADSVEIA